MGSNIGKEKDDQSVYIYRLTQSETGSSYKIDKYTKTTSNDIFLKETFVDQNIIYKIYNCGLTSSDLKQNKDKAIYNFKLYINGKYSNIQMYYKITSDSLNYNFYCSKNEIEQKIKSTNLCETIDQIEDYFVNYLKKNKKIILK